MTRVVSGLYSKRMNRIFEILLVEDNPADVRLTMEAFKDAKILSNIHVARDGEEAMRFLRHSGDFASAPTPDLVLLDLNLPKKDGREVLREIKSDPRLRRIPVVVLTTSSDESDVHSAYDMFVNAYVTKPVDLDQFMKIVSVIDEFWLSIVKLPPHGSV